MNESKGDFNPKRNLLTLCLASFTVVTGFGVIMPFFPLYASEILSDIQFFGFFDIGIALQIGIMTSAFMFTRFLLAPTFGDLSDSTGRKPLILVGMSLYGALMVGFGLAFDFVSLLILRAAQGIASAAVWPVGEALIVDTSPKDKVGRNLGYYMTSMQAGMASGPFLGFAFYFLFESVIGLSVTLSYKLTFCSVGILGLLATIIIAKMVQDPSLETRDSSLKALYISSAIAMMMRIRKSPGFLVQSLRNGEDNAYRNRSIYSVYMVAAINGFGFAMIFPIATLFLFDYYSLDPGFIALLIGIVGLPALTGGPLGGYLSDKLGRKATICTSGFIVGLLFLALGIEMAIPLLMVFFLINRFLFGVIQPSFRALQSDLVPPEVRGKEFGILQAFFNLGAAMGPIVGGLLYDAFFMKNTDLGNNITYLGAGMAFAVAGVFALLASILLFILVDYNKHRIVEGLELQISPITPLLSE
ncbi:MAG: MFS transporter [Candidatus Hodarchaeales archaeon]|jgi:MFS family permease